MSVLFLVHFAPHPIKPATTPARSCIAGVRRTSFRGAPSTAAELGTEVQPAVVVVVAEVPGLPLDALTAASAVLESCLYPRAEHLPTHAVGRAVSACFPCFRS